MSHFAFDWQHFGYWTGCLLIGVLVGFAMPRIAPYLHGWRQGLTIVATYIVLDTLWIFVWLGFLHLTGRNT